MEPAEKEKRDEDVVVTAVLSAMFVNDTICIVMTPLVL